MLFTDIISIQNSFNPYLFFFNTLKLLSFSLSFSLRRSSCFNWLCVADLVWPLCLAQVLAPTSPLELGAAVASPGSEGSAAQRRC